MTLLIGKLADIHSEEGMKIGRVRVKGAVEKVQLLLTPVAKVGDDVLIDSGVAVAIVDNDLQTDVEKGNSNGGREKCAWPYREKSLTSTGTRNR